MAAKTMTAAKTVTAAKAAKKRKTPHETNPLYEGRATCKCAEEVNKLLKPTNTRLVTTLFTGHVALLTEKADVAERQKPKTLTAIYCPFCGTQYPVAGETQTSATEITKAKVA